MDYLDGINWNLFEEKIKKAVASALQQAVEVSVHLGSGDKPGRSWKLTSGEIQTRVENALAAREPFNIRALTSGDTPAAFILEPGGGFIDPRNIRFLTSGDTPRITHKLDGGNFLNNVTLGALASTDALVIDAPSFTIGIKKTAGPASMTVTHYVQLYPGGQWFEVADDTFNTDLVATFNHRVYAYRFKNKLSATSATVTVDYRRWK